ncbi:hypothetical protein HFO09_07805 [Rhizobium laguerreae]|uniref:hypothetical protein n=1 Tax=Rhizobium laguerreae TaxID=1076926 RepID=UPI001C9120DB|nr:hypothetical protein [Rhizobium laguerreae]MBY3255596.1 hypothetical protein [Rhizobium laguerreae]MBY3282635.1 hypothetical protein [Rhizobium laguerreae]MBY3288989.1 hypothetical protein [Rhizobium laguerreae]
MTDTGERLAIDVTSVKGKLKDHKDLADLVKAITSYEASQSILAELREASSTIDEIAKIQLDPTMRKRVGAALMTHAVITYCRATHSKSDARWKVGIVNRYSADQAQKHRRIVDLRDKVIAHFGFPGEAHGARWHDERVVAKVVNGVESNGLVLKRANFLADAIADLIELLSVAIEEGKRIGEERGKAMSEAILSKLDDQRVLSAFQSSPFDPYTFWGPGEAADAFWGIAHGEKTERFVLPFQTSFQISGRATTSG